MNSTGAPSRATRDPAPQQARVSPWVLWCGLLLAPTGFSVQVMASYGVAAGPCSAGGSGPAWLWSFSAAAVVLAALGAGCALHAWRATRAEKEGDARELADRGEGRTRFMGMFGLTSSGLLLVATLFLATSLGFYGGCPGPLPG